MAVPLVVTSSLTLPSLLKRPNVDDSVEIIRSNKGGLKLIHRGYMYTVHKRRQSGSIRWRCTQRALNCKGSISTSCGVTKVNMPHNHVPDPFSVAVARGKHEKIDESELYQEETTQHQQVDYYDEEEDFFDIDSDMSPLVPPLQQSTPQIRILQPVKMTSDPPTSPKKPPEAAETSQMPNNTNNNNNNKDLALDSEEVCLRWNSHHSNMISAFPALLQREQYVDVTLCTEGQTIRCHRLVLSSCSTYFEEILSCITPLQHPVIFLKGTPFWILKSLIDFMYIGEAHIEQSKLQEILDVAEALKIKGLTGNKKTQSKAKQTANTASSVNTSINNTNNVNTSTQLKANVSTTNVKKETTHKEINTHKEPIEKVAQTFSKPPPPMTPILKSFKITKESSQILNTTTTTVAKKPTVAKTTEINVKIAAEAKSDAKINSTKKEIVVKQLPQSSNKLLTKKTKVKRKSSEIEAPPPPPVVTRKGTKSRPIVKAPRYYHTEFENNYKKSELQQQRAKDDLKKSALNASSSSTSSLTESGQLLTKIKSEPLDVDETDMSFGHFLSTGTINFEDNNSEQQTPPPPKRAAILVPKSSLIPKSTLEQKPALVQQKPISKVQLQHSITPKLEVVESSEETDITLNKMNKTNDKCEEEDEEEGGKGGVETPKEIMKMPVITSTVSLSSLSSDKSNNEGLSPG